MRFVNPIVCVSDLARSRAFYEDVLGLVVERGDDTFVRFEDGLAIHDEAALHRTVWKEDPPPASGRPSGKLLLYFEHEDLEGVVRRLPDAVRLIHPIERQPWGQSVVRFLDPDGHAIEIGEPGY